LSNTTKEWLKDLHLQYYDNNIFAFHASPLNNQEYFFEKIDNGIVTIKGNNELLKTINNIGQKYIVFGHSHIERVISVDKYVCINAGSVGLPAYDDENPYHKMESFNQKAKYVIINNNEITIKYIDYNYKDAAKQAVKIDRRDWEKWILDGRV
jgi:predicted phosphodiesterase